MGRRAVQRALWFLGAWFASLSAGCLWELEGAPCPCADGYVCCPRNDRCYEPGAACFDPRESDAGVSEHADALTLPRHCNQDGWCGARYPFSVVTGLGPDDVWATAQDPDAGEPPAMLHWDGVRWHNYVNPYLIDSYRVRAGTAVGQDVWFVGSDADTAFAFRWAGEYWDMMWFVIDARDFRAVWAPAEDDVWAVGAAGATGHWNGTEWLARPPATEADLNAVWGGSSSDAWAAGAGGVLLRYGGNGWTVLPDDQRPSRADLHALWGRAVDDVWAVGAEGTVLHFDGLSWRVVEHGLALGAEVTFTALHGTDEALWLSTSDGRLVHFDGARWSEAARARHGLQAVWVAETGALWSVGEGGAALSFDGARWQATPAPSTFDLFDVWGSSVTDLWSVGADGVILHGDGHGFRSVEAPSGTDLHAVHGSAADDVWAVGARIMHFDGVAWSLVAESEDLLRDVLALSARTAWAVGDGGVILRWDGQAWSESARFPDLTFRTVWGGAEDDVWALDRRDGVVHWNGRAWERARTPGGALTDTPTGQLMTGSAPDDMWLLTTHDDADGVRWLERNLWDGTTFQTYDSLEWWGQLERAWPRKRRDFWMVGQQVWKFTAGEREWSYRSLDVTLHGIWADVEDAWAVGDEGTILHREPVIIAL